MRSRNYFASILILISIILGFSSCKKPSKDIRDLAVGTYNGTIDTYFYRDSTIISTEYEGTELFPQRSATFVLTKDNSNVNNLIIQIGEHSCTGSNITETFDGFTFEIKNQFISDSLIYGYNPKNMNDNSYHGKFSSTTNNFEFGLKTIYETFYLDENYNPIDNIEGKLNIDGIVYIYKATKNL